MLRAMRDFPSIIEWSCQSLEPHRLILYLMEIANDFHVFYTKYRVINDDAALTSARIRLVKALRQVFSIALDILGVTCSEKM
jgi:arginyl-tRNA synthetase